MNAKHEHYFLNKTYSIKTNYKVEPSFLLKLNNLIINFRSNILYNFYKIINIKIKKALSYREASSRELNVLETFFS